MPIIKRFGVHFNYPGDGVGYSAYTLHAESICEAHMKEEDVRDIVYSRTHPDGWTISAKPKADWFVWVSEFDAIHPQYGRVWGNFEVSVEADSEEGFTHFFENHTPYAWDYGDI